MPRRIFIFDPPDRFVCGTVGPMGERTFFLQALEGDRIVSVVLEKIQVAAIAERIGVIVADLDRQGGSSSAPAVGDDDRPLDEPVREEFRVGTIALSWDAEEAVIMIEAREQTGEEDEDLEVDDEDPDGPDLLRVHLPVAAAKGFAERAARVVAGGRPPCPFCGQPLDPQGHLCARRNGYLN
ncbi:MAG: DUF3090 family protein [Chloroflexota bacterium]|nr:DUF3090 family protein [Chloroflexota bacterium]